MNLSIPILFEDANVIVVHKPAGLLSQEDISRDPSVVSLLREYLGRPYVGLIHRLDRNTSGALIVAKRTKAATRLTEQLQSGKLTRTYLALLEGHLPAGQTLNWSHFLQKNEATNTVRVLSHSAGGKAKTAKLSLRSLAQTQTPGGHAITAAEFTLETGRSHQIRAQSAFERHPILGDPKYGKPSREISRPALHSWKLSFEHPISKERIRLEAPLPEDFLALWPSLPATIR